MKQIEAKTDFKPEVVLVLGTGLGSYVDNLDVKTTIPYKDIIVTARTPYIRGARAVLY